MRRARPSYLWAWYRTRPQVAYALNQHGPDPVAESELEELATGQSRYSLIKWWHYFEVYERHLGPLARDSRAGTRDLPLRILEIGVLDGGSLELWSKWFGENALIYGIDVDQRCAELSVPGAEVRIGSQDDSHFLRRVVDEMGGVDVVIDDGNHTSHSVRTSLRTLFPLLSDSGLYVIEDLHASYWPSFGGGLRRSSSSIEALKRTIDLLHQPYIGTALQSDVLGLAADRLKSVTFYDSIAILEKQASRSTFLHRSDGLKVVST